MKKEKSSAMGTPYTFEGRIPLKQAIPLGLQHVMAMFVGNLTPLLIIMGDCYGYIFWIPRRIQERDSRGGTGRADVRR